MVAAASADAVLLTLALALPEPVPEVPAAGAVERDETVLVKDELPVALTLAALPMPLTVTWLLAFSLLGATAAVEELLDTKEPEITPVAASLAAAEDEYSEAAVVDAVL